LLGDSPGPITHLTLLIRLFVLAYSHTFPRDLIIGQIDHFPDSERYAPHTNATFRQRYSFDSSYYKPGGPVFLYLSGETSGESRFSNLQNGSKGINNINWLLFISNSGSHSNIDAGPMALELFSRIGSMGKTTHDG
jgi:hypothetical protein